MSAKHPIQPLVMVEAVLRFKQNKIVRDLLDAARRAGLMDLNSIAAGDYSQEDREQLLQLIGYSHSGAGDHRWMSDEVWSAAQEMHEHGESEQDARINALRQSVQVLGDALQNIQRIAEESLPVGFEGSPQ